MKNPPPLLPENGVSTTYEQVVGQTRTPLATWSDVKSAFGEQAVDSGSVNLDLKTKDGFKNRQKLVEMTMPHYRQEHRRSETRNAKVATVKMRLPDGALRRVPEGSAARAERNGLRAISGRNPHLRYFNGRWFRRFGTEWRPDV